MRQLTTQELDHITKLIVEQVEFFNGWKVSEDSVESACWKAACRIENYLKRRDKRENLSST